MIPGEKITIGRNEYTVPPANIASMRQHRALMDRFAGRGNGAQPGPDDVFEISELVHETLKRNYPALELADIEQDLDIGTLLAAFNAIMTAGAAGPAPSGETKPASR